jgi:23S rRNA pseudouridine1911/1915/1917 synthase
LELIQRQALHSWRLEFTHPVTGELMQLEAPLPADMTALMRQMT